MSKKIILEITPEVARKIQDFLTSAEKIAPDEADTWDQIVQQLGGNLERSMIEWHKPIKRDQSFDNIPTNVGERVLVRTKDGECLAECVCSITGGGYFLYYHQDWEDVDAWAYLPEGGEE